MSLIKQGEIKIDFSLLFIMPSLISFQMGWCANLAMEIYFPRHTVKKSA